MRQRGKVMESKGNIAIIEDNIELQFLYKMVLESEGYTVAYTARNGEKALEEYKRCAHRPDLFIIDNRLYNSSGMDTAKDIQKIDPKARFLFATVDRNLDGRMEGVNAIGVLYKPFSMRKLTNTIHSAMETR
ncbi:hypothetical protein CUJ83_01200 [Methanocella sp. CWC-04]|uniref:Response regulatory domain-containing protein n=1 Tax=Methanooceanicella nereidis TaxID=2052831 RepID=A0AAP2R9Y3_9EURY|nr:response regulator [Methanocella sp. CWC-04]MCD1293614.1 hypothetical protein [Methanocella sp. CWC-04]